MAKHCIPPVPRFWTDFLLHQLAPQIGRMSKDLSELDKLIKESEAAIQRLDDVQKARHNAPLMDRVRRHLHKNSPHLLNVLMAGTVLVVALGKLDQKHKHQVRV